MADRRITKKVIAAGTFHRRVVTLESMNYYSSSRLTRIVYQCENVNMQMWRVPRSGYFTAADVNKPMMMAHRQKTTGVILRIAISVSILWPVDFRLWCVSVCVCVETGWWMLVWRRVGSTNSAAAADKSWAPPRIAFIIHRERWRLTTAAPISALGTADARISRTSCAFYRVSQKKNWQPLNWLITYSFFRFETYGKK